MSLFRHIAPMTDLAAWTGAFPLAAHVTLLASPEPLDVTTTAATYIGGTFVAETVAEVAAHLLATGWTEHATDERDAPTARFFHHAADGLAATVEFGRDAVAAGRA